jgi:uncharacterized protein
MPFGGSASAFAADRPPHPVRATTGTMSARNRGQFQPGTSGNPRGRPTKQAQLARRDSFVNTFTGHGTPDDRRFFTSHQTTVVTDLQGIDLRRGNWLAKRICDLLPSECFRRGWTLKLDDKEVADKVTNLADDLAVNARLTEAGQMERATGGAALFPVLDGALGDLSEPLELDDGPSRIGAVLAIHLLETRELTPIEWYSDITSPKFRKPSRYRLYPLSGGGAYAGPVQIIHESRLAIFPGSRASVQILPGQRPGWGDSALTPCGEVINDYGLAWGSAASILHTFSQRVLKLNGMMQMLAQGGTQLVQARVQIMDLFRSALRTEVIDGDDDISHLVTSTAGLSDLLVQFAQVVSAAADTPSTRLFGMHPGGLHATGQFDQDGWFERVANEQTHKYTCPAQWLLRLLFLSADGPTNGKEPESWSIEWNPLEEPTEKENADSRLAVAQADQIYADLGAPPESILRSRFGGDAYSPDTTIDWADFEQKRKQQETRMAVAAAIPRSAVPIPGADPAAPPVNGKSNGKPAE